MALYYEILCLYIVYKVNGIFLAANINCVVLKFSTARSQIEWLIQATRGNQQ